MLVENIVAQTLRALGHKLYFYSRNDPSHRENHMEVDFLITKGKKICPIEVKSGDYRGHSSIDKFQQKFSQNIGERYVIHTKDFATGPNLTYLPLYMTMCL